MSPLTTTAKQSDSGTLPQHDREMGACSSSHGGAIGQDAPPASVFNTRKVLLKPLAPGYLNALDEEGGQSSRIQYLVSSLPLTAFQDDRCRPLRLCSKHCYGEPGCPPVALKGSDQSNPSGSSPPVTQCFPGRPQSLARAVQQGSECHVPLCYSRGSNIEQHFREISVGNRIEKLVISGSEKRRTAVLIPHQMEPCQLAFLLNSITTKQAVELALPQHVQSRLIKKTTCQGDSNSEYFIGKGTFGIVKFACIYNFSNSGLVDGELVAVKKILLRGSYHQEYLRMEYSCMQLLKGLNICPYPLALSMTTNSQNKAVGMLFMEIKAGCDGNVFRNKCCLNQKFGTLSRFYAAIDLTRKLQRMHKKKVFHRDIKWNNLIISYENKRIDATFIDFGLSCQGEMCSPTLKHCFPTPTYLAPESSRHRHVLLNSAAIDVFGLGVIFVELLGGASCTDGYWAKQGEWPSMENVLPKAYEKQIDTLIETALSRYTFPSEAIQGMIRKMLAGDPSDRPSVPEIFNHLTAVVENLKGLSSQGAQLNLDNKQK